MNFAHRRLNRNTGKVIFIDLIVKNKFPAYFHFDFCAAQEDFAIFFFFFFTSDAFRVRSFWRGKEGMPSRKQSVKRDLWERRVEKCITRVTSSVCRQGTRRSTINFVRESTRYRRVDEPCLNKYTAVGNYEYIVITGQLVRWISVS